MTPYNYYYQMQNSVSAPAGLSNYIDPYDYSVLANAAKTGAIVGAAGAAAMQLHRYRQEGTSWQAAASNTAVGAMQVAVATTAATAVGQMFKQNSLLSLAATLATGTAVMYALSNTQEKSTDE